MPRSLSSLRQRLDTRKRLRQPSGFRIALADSIALMPAAWDEIAGHASWFFSRDYCTMLERVPPEVIEPRYALIADAEGPLALVMLQWAEIEGRRLRSTPDIDDGDSKDVSPLRKLLGGIGQSAKRAVVSSLRERVLVCGNLLTYGQHAVAVAPGVDPGSLWPAIAEVIYRVRRAEKLAGQAGFVLVKDLEAAHLDESQLLKGLSYRPVETEPNMVLQLDPRWKTHDDYLGSLTSKYRSAVKNQVIQPIAKAGLEVRGFDVHPDMAPALHGLYLQVHRNAKLRPFTLHPDYFSALFAAAGERCRFAGVFDGQRLLGFIATLLDGEQAIAYHIGFERQPDVPLPLYLRLLHASINDAIALGAREVSFGRTALEPKARLGAKPRELHVWARHRNPVFNRMIHPLLGFAQHDEAPETNPFKSDTVSGKVSSAVTMKV